MFNLKKSLTRDIYRDEAQVSSSGGSPETSGMKPSLELLVITQRTVLRQTRGIVRFFIVLFKFG